MLSLVPLALFGLVPASAGPAFGGAGGSVPPDPFAHPRFALSFLNDLPIGRSFADALVRRQEDQQQQRGAASEELLTTQAELGRPAGSRVADLGWFFASGPAQASRGSRGEIAGASMPEEESDGVDEREPLSSAAEHRRPGGGDGLPPVGNHTLQTFLLPPSRSYLCLLPPPASSDPTSPSPDTPVEADEPAFDPDLPERLLRHLSSSCLFVRAGWFTYSYCHNGEVRQFREKTRSNWPPAADAWVPVVDEEYDDYVLGVRVLCSSEALLRLRLKAEARCSSRSGRPCHRTANRLTRPPSIPRRSSARAPARPTSILGRVKPAAPRPRTRTTRTTPAGRSHPSRSLGAPARGI